MTMAQRVMFPDWGGDLRFFQCFDTVGRATKGIQPIKICSTYPQPNLGATPENKAS